MSAVLSLCATTGYSQTPALVSWAIFILIIPGLTVPLGDIVNILGNFVPISGHPFTSTIVVNSKSNFLIQHPDLLLTVTALSNTLKCRRKPLLASLVRSSSDITPSLVWGNMLHEVMQTCLNTGRWEEAWITERISEVINNGFMELVKIGVGAEQAKRELNSRAKGLRKFAEKYIATVPKVSLAS